MGVRNILAVLLCLAALPPAVRAEPRSDKDAGTAVEQWLRLDATPFNTRIGNKLDKTVSLKNANGEVFAFVVYLRPRGFVIVPADDEVEPFMAFSGGTKFIFSDEHPFGALVLHDVAGRVDTARRAQRSVAPGKTRVRPPHAAAAHSKWDLFRNRLPLLDAPTARDNAIVLMGLGTITDVRVQPLVQSKWNQGKEGADYCYNYYTPNNYVCGCVATAMAQLMRYFQKPTLGVGTSSFGITVDGVATTRSLRGGDGSGGPYDWANMPLDPDSGTSTAQRQAIGALCHDAGVAAHMGYAGAGSGATLNNALTALTDVFGYSSVIHGGPGDARDISGTTLNTMINPTLDAKLPAILGILRDGNNGHAVVCDGYGYTSGTLYHHINMGWGGSDDAWYNLPTINGSLFSYNAVYACLYNVYLSGDGEIVSGRITNSSGNAVTGVVVTARNGSGPLYSATSDGNGIYAIVKVPSSATYTLTAAGTGYVFSNQTVNTGLSASFTLQSGNVWGKDFLAIPSYCPANPGGFDAENIGMHNIDLRWARNASNDDVLIAWKTNGAFGVPSGLYVPGDPIGGGGTVLYVGSATNFSHTGLVASTVYSYRAWSFDAATNYSPGASLSATTSVGVANPATFTSPDRGLSYIDLQWTRNPSNDSVLVAWKTNGTFGVPSGLYAQGNPIAGGGTVLYAGSATGFSHTGLVSSTVYDYRAWSFDAATNYSSGTSLSARTFFIYYVNDSSTAGDVWCTAAGNDAYSAMSSNAPKATVQAVLDAYDLKPGDSIHVDTGHYVLLSNIVVGAGDQGSAQFSVTLRGSPNGTVIDRRCGTNGAYGIFLDHVSCINLLDLSFTSGYYAVYMSYADTCVASNLSVAGATNTGIYLSYSAGNRFDGFRISGCRIKGLYANQSGYNKFTRGLVHNNSGSGMDFQYDINTLVENCTVAFNTNYQVYLKETVLAMTNTIASANAAGSSCIFWSSGTYIGDYNNLWTNNGASVGYCNGSKATLAAWQTATAQDAHSLSADPLFVNSSSGDFHLQSTAGSYHGGAWTLDAKTSPAIDAGPTTYAYYLEPSPNGGCINLGAYGNTPQASKSVDSDGDGLSDTFEVRVGSNPAEADSDHDGMGDGDERTAGTDPTNAASVFAITEVTQPDPYFAEVRWYSVTNRLYAIDRATNLMAGGFAAVTNNIAATPPVNVYTDIVTGLGNTLFYRVKTQP